MVEAKKELLAFKKSFDLEIRNYFEEEREKALKVSPELGPLFTAMGRYLLSGGKRIRPYLFCKSFEGLRGRRKKIIDEAIFVELIHSELMAFDDIMDRSELRHGVKTIHQSQEEYFAKKYQAQDAPHFGRSAGILAGALYAHLANSLLSRSDFQSKNVLNLVEYYNTIVVRTSYGQYKDLLLPYKEDVTKKDIEQVHLYKTAKYTIEGPLIGGAILAGASKGAIKKISEFAIPLGLAFQIVDDLIGAFGKTSKIGKPALSDLSEGKQTYLTLFVFNKGKRSDRSQLKKLLRKEDVRISDLKRFRNILLKSGAKEYSEKKALQYLEVAKEALEDVPYSITMKEKLSDLSEYIVRRKL